MHLLRRWTRNCQQAKDEPVPKRWLLKQCYEVTRKKKDYDRGAEEEAQPESEAAQHIAQMQESGMVWLLKEKISPFNLTKKSSNKAQNKQEDWKKKSPLLSWRSFKGIVHPKTKMHSSSTQHYGDGGVGEVCELEDHSWHVGSKHGLNDLV